MILEKQKTHKNVFFETVKKIILNRSKNQNLDLFKSCNRLSVVRTVNRPAQKNKKLPSCVFPQTCCAVRGSYVLEKRIRSKFCARARFPLPPCVASRGHVLENHKNTKKLTKRVAVARKSVMSKPNHIIFRAGAHGGRRFGQNHRF